LLRAVIHIALEVLVLIDEMLCKFLKLLPLTLDGLFGASFIVACVGQLLDTALDLIRVVFNLFIRRIFDLPIKRLAATILFRRVVYDLNFYLRRVAVDYNFGVVVLLIRKLVWLHTYSLCAANATGVFHDTFHLIVIDHAELFAVNLEART
jgi:hypothetical protein